MILELLEIAGVMIGGLVTVFLFALNIVSLVRGRRIFRSHRSWRANL